MVAVIQCVTAIVLWLRRRVSPQVMGLSVALLVLVMFEVWAGRHKHYWMHVPMGVGILMWLRGRVAREFR